MNQEQVLDHQVLKYVPETYRHVRGRHLSDTYIEEGEEEYFEYLIKVEISKGWIPQGDYNLEGEVGPYKRVPIHGQVEYRQTMVKYSGFVTSETPTHIKTRIQRDKKGRQLGGGDCLWKKHTKETK